jgi:hypothetical protein
MAEQPIAGAEVTRFFRAPLVVCRSRLHILASQAAFLKILLALFLAPCQAALGGMRTRNVPHHVVVRIPARAPGHAASFAFEGPRVATSGLIVLIWRILLVGTGRRPRPSSARRAQVANATL